MDQEVELAVEELTSQGIGVDADSSWLHSKAYVLEAPNGEKYRFTGPELLNLKAKEKLHLEGLQEAHLAKKDTPNL
jgi:hypothetical protein